MKAKSGPFSSRFLLGSFLAVLYLYMIKEPIWSNVLRRYEGLDHVEYWYKHGDGIGSEKAQVMV